MAQASERLLVVGAIGSIGRPVVRTGLAEGYAVRALVRDGLDRAQDAPNMPLGDEPAQVIADLERIRAALPNPTRA